MGITKITYKNKINKDLRIEDNNLEEDMKLINNLSLGDLNSDDVFTFKVELCNNEVDRVGDKMTSNFLNQLADRVVGLTGLKDHDWSSDNQISRIYDAHVVTDNTIRNRSGDVREYIEAKVYTLKKYQDYIDKINSGLLKECSISFESEGDICSICGRPTSKVEDAAVCENKHIAGEVYDGKLCYNIIDNLRDVMEFSLVAVPCQRSAGIKNKDLKIGGKITMKKVELLLRQFMSSKSYDKAYEEDKIKIEESLNTKADDDLTDEDIKNLIEENVKLKEKVKGLETKLKEAVDGRTRDKIETIIADKIDKMHPLNDKVKECFMKELPWDDLRLEEDGQIPGLEDVFNKMCKAYKGLFVNEEDIEAIGGHDEPDGDEAAVLKINDREEPDGDEGKIMVSNEQKRKSLSFGVNTSKNKSKASSNTKPGIYFK